MTAAAKLIEDAYNAGDGKAVLEGFCAEHEKTIRAGEGEESFAKGVTSLAESGKLDPAAKTKIVVKGEVASGAWEASMSAGPGGSTTVTFRDETGEWCLDPNPGTK